MDLLAEDIALLEGPLEGTESENLPILFIQNRLRNLDQR